MEKPAIILEWQGQEFEFEQKDSSWYWTVGILSSSAALAAFIVGNILFGIILILAGFTTALLASRHPALHTFKMSDRGIHVNDRIYKYENMVRFAIDEDGGKKLLFELKEGLIKVITVPLDNTNHQQLRMELKNRDIEEVEHLNTFVARVSDWMGLS